MFSFLFVGQIDTDACVRGDAVATAVLADDDDDDDDDDGLERNDDAAAAAGSSSGDKYEWN